MSPSTGTIEYTQAARPEILQLISFPFLYAAAKESIVNCAGSTYIKTTSGLNSALFSGDITTPEQLPEGKRGN
ncbi:MAG: hypothetical protein QXS79_03200 [Candidatus Bathyarchaeia archaeon]